MITTLKAASLYLILAILCLQAPAAPLNVLIDAQYLFGSAEVPRSREYESFEAERFEEARHKESWLRLAPAFLAALQNHGIKVYIYQLTHEYGKTVQTRLNEINWSDRNGETHNGLELIDRTVSFRELHSTLWRQFGYEFDGKPTLHTLLTLIDYHEFATSSLPRDKQQETIGAAKAFWKEVELKTGIPLLSSTWDTSTATWYFRDDPQRLRTFLDLAKKHFPEYYDLLHLEQHTDLSDLFFIVGKNPSPLPLRFRFHENYQGGFNPRDTVLLLKGKLVFDENLANRIPFTALNKQILRTPWEDLFPWNAKIELPQNEEWRATRTRLEVFKNVAAALTIQPDQKIITMGYLTQLLIEIHDALTLDGQAVPASIAKEREEFPSLYAGKRPINTETLVSPKFRNRVAEGLWSMVHAANTLNALSTFRYTSLAPVICQKYLLK